MSNKQNAIDFLEMIVAHKIKEAYAKHVSPKMTHHCAWFPSDRESLMNGMIEAHTKNPNITIDIKHALEDGEYVAVHLHVRHNATELGYAVVHLFRFDKSGKIAEMWDIGQAVPKESPNKKGMF